MPDEGPLRFVAPSQMQSIASCRSWNLGEVPTDGRPVVVDLSRWRYVSPTPVVGLLATIGMLVGEDHAVEVIEPAAPYPRRMLETVGFTDALRTFAEVTRTAEPPEAVRRYYPLIPARNFRSFDDVECIARELSCAFGSNRHVSGPLDAEADTAITEAANNAVEHAHCAEGGFALAQLRHRRPRGGTASWFIEIAVADGGRGIAASLGESDNDREAILRALDESVTGTGEPYRGIGLAEMEQLVQYPRRELAIHSGTGLVTVTRSGREAAETPHRFPGTLLRISLPAGQS